MTGKFTASFSVGCSEFQKNDFGNYLSAGAGPLRTFPSFPAFPVTDVVPPDDGARHRSRTGAPIAGRHFNLNFATSLSN
jgi:hypothetical protein